MTTFYDVPAEALIEAVAEQLEDELDEPEWVGIAKTGVSRELPPEQENFWYLRCASLLRKVAIDGPVGVERLRVAYGDSTQGSTRFRVRADQKARSSGKIIRTALQDLEEADYVAQNPDGRIVSGPGRAMLDEVATEVLEELDRPELERYA
jgi:small subunit ribosomal protein S19e